MAKGNNNLPGRRLTSRNSKPYDANNSFVKKVATKVTDLIPQRSWISKWFNNSQGNGDILDDTDTPEDVESEEEGQKPPPLKRPCIRMDITHPPGTFSIQPRVKNPYDKDDPCKQQYSNHNDTSDDFLEPVAGSSRIGHLISSTPAVETDMRSIAPQRSQLNSLVMSSNNGTANGMDDNSESSESTSGCSSLIPQTNRQEVPPHVSYNSTLCNRKRFMDDKFTFSNHLQSPRSLFLDNSSRDSLSSRRPSFNASVMSNTLERASPLSSPFYSGNITFGGANTAGLHKRSRSMLQNTSELQLKVPKRASVEVKPSNTAGADSSGMSQTAKKILEALEHFSSSIKTTTTTSTSRKRGRDETSSPTAKIGFRHMTRELTIPTVPDILKLKRRQKLQDTTVAARRIVSARSEPPPPQEYKLRVFSKYQSDDHQKYHGKIKSRGNMYLEGEGTVEAINLPSIPLPITSLPNFDFAPPSSKNLAEKNIKSNEETFKFASPIKITNATTTLKSINNFTFSSPISAESKNGCPDSQTSSEIFDGKSDGSVANSTPTLTQNFMWSGSSTAPRLKEKAKNKDNSMFAASQALKTGSAMNILSSKYSKSELNTTSGASIKFTAEEGSKRNASTFSANVADDIGGKSAVLKNDKPQDIPTVWECSECFIKNSGTEPQCSACKTPKNYKSNKIIEISKPTEDSKPKSAEKDCFGSQFKLSTNQWECTSCLVRNKQTVVKCVACSAPKPSMKQELELTTVKATDSDLLSKFKPAEGSWECPDCMLRNNATAASCVCCNASKPNSLKITPKKDKTNDGNATSKEKTVASTVNLGPQTSSGVNTGLMEKFKPSKDTWECPSCMVRNAASANTCPCCNTANPASPVNATPVKKMDSLPTNGFGDKFKKPEGAWTCDSCMIQNQGNVTECIACNAAKPGTKKDSTTSNTGSTLQFNFGIPPSAGGFKFGIDKADQKKDNTLPVNGFNFGDPLPTGEVKSFTFGIQKEQKETSEVATKTGFQINTNKEQGSESAEQKAVPSFVFGLPKTAGETVPNEKPTANTTSSSILAASGFTFGVPKSETKQANSNENHITPLGTVAKEVPKPSTETTNSLSMANQSNTSTPVTQSGLQDTKTTTTFAFGMPNNKPTQNVNNTSATVTSLPSSFAFPETKKIVKPATGQSTTAPTWAPPPHLSSSFSFTENKAREVTPASITKNPTELPSASSGPSLFANISGSTSLFGNNEVKTIPTFGAKEDKPLAFGASESKPSAFVIPNKVPSFGTTENKPSLFGTPETKVPVFGNADKSTPVFSPIPQTPAATPTATPTVTPTPTPATAATPTPAPAFGSVPAATPSPFGSFTPATFGAGPTPNLFCTTKPSESTTTNSNLFTFGATSAQPVVAQPASGFNFSGNSNPPESTQKPLFTFGGSANQAQSSNLFGGSTFNNPAPSNTTGFTFNAPKPEVAAFGQPAVAPPMFGAPNIGAQANAQNTATPSFSSTPASNTGFNFGSTASATPAGGFNFGGMAPASVPPGEFKFNAASPTPTFDPNTRPSFNFTGGSAPPTFNATPQTSSRKIKKAVRRIR